MSQTEVSLEQRQRDYAEAEAHALATSEKFVEARASGWTTLPAYKAHDAMDRAQAALKSAKRRLEATERRLAKRRESA